MVGNSAEEIDVTLFREIIFVPLTIDAKDDNDPGLMTGRQRMKETIRLLGSSEPWKRQQDLLAHLPQDRPAGGDGAAGDQEKQRLYDLKRRRAQYEEYVYFEPYVQRFLYRTTPRKQDKPRTPFTPWPASAGDREQDAGPIALFFRDDIKSIEVSYRLQEHGPEHPDPESGARFYSFNIDRCNLYLYETGNAVLVLELNLNLPGAVQEDSDAGSGQSLNFKPVTLAECQTIIENLRRVFPPYFTEEKGRVGDPDAELEAVYYAREFRWRPKGEAGVRVQPEKQIGQVIDNPGGRAPPMFEPWRFLLDPIEVEGSERPTRAAGSAKRHEGPRVRFGQTGDDRGFVMAQIGVPTSFDIKRSDWVRLCFCDAPGSGYSYSPSILKKFEGTYCYDRFFDYETQDAYKSTRYVMCSYAFIMVGSCQNDVKDYFYHMFSRHFRRIYFQLVLISVYQKVALLSLSERLAEALDSGAFQDRSEAIHEEILMFTHRYWFEEISAQIQGHELFSMLRGHMRTEKLYKQLSQEVRETTDRLAVLRQDRLNRLAGVGLVLATFVGFFGMNVFGEGELLGQVRWPVFLLFLVAIAGLFAAIYFRGQQVWVAARPALHRLAALWRKVRHESVRLLPRRPRPRDGGDREADPPARADG
jgi:hypothetical protein